MWAVPADGSAEEQPQVVQWHEVKRIVYCDEIAFAVFLVGHHFVFADEVDGYAGGEGCVDYRRACETGGTEYFVRDYLV